MLKTVSWAKIELTKYTRLFTILFICFSLVEIFLLSWLDTHEILKSGDFTLPAFQVFNNIFISMIGTSVPVTLIFTISGEFSNGYVQKLISNGCSRIQYFLSKYILAMALAIMTMLFYIGIFLLLYLIARVKTFEGTLLIRSTLFSFLFSLFFSGIIVSITLWTKNWQYALLVYYGYYFLEGFIVFWLRDKIPFVRYLPMQSAVSIFRIKSESDGFSYLIASGAILSLTVIAFSLLSYRQFKRSDLA
jgi:putative exporter of polyketide antibiotics